jgi:hypothetical protein
VSHDGRENRNSVFSGLHKSKELSMSLRMDDPSTCQVPFGQLLAQYRAANRTLDLVINRTY